MLKIKKVLINIFCYFKYYTMCMKLYFYYFKYYNNDCVYISSSYQYVLDSSNFKF